MPTASDPFDLQRFVSAQAPIYLQALAELRAGRKRSHWSWYVLPQLRGLGSSAMSMRYGISGLAEARAYLSHRILGPRLTECVAAVNGLVGLDAQAVLGEVDAQKFQSCVSLFALACGTAESVFSTALEKYFSGRRDESTDAILRLHAE